MKTKFLFLIIFLLLCYIGKSIELKNSYYQIISHEYQESINIPGASDYDGEQLIIWDKADCRFNQEWKFEPIGSYYIIRSKYNNKVITADKFIVIQKDYNNTENQLWSIQVINNWLYIISAKNRLALSVEISQTKTKELVLTKFNKSVTQRWYLEPSGLEYHKDDFNRIVSPYEMKADVDYFFNKLEEVHVNPYAFFSKDSIEKRKKVLLDELLQPLKRYDFCRKISSLNSLFDGHTGIQGMDYDYYHSYMNSYGRFLPFNFNYSPQNLFFNTDVDSLKHQTILSINQIPFSKISAEIELRINNETRQMRNTKIQEEFHALLFGLFDIQSPFYIEVFDTLLKVRKNYTISGLNYFNLPFAQRSEIEPYSFRIYPADSIAIIEYNTCGIINMGSFNIFIDSVFSVINENNIKHLFIDISRNGGGSTSTNNSFYRNINHTPKNWSERNIKKISQESKLHALGLSLVFNSGSFEERKLKYDSILKTGNLSPWQSHIVDMKDGELYKSEIHYCDDNVQNGYSNNLYIIQSERTYSAAMDMSAWFHYSDVGLIIGSETGGTTEVYIESINLFLPYSKLFFRIADNYCTYPNGQLHRGIMPKVTLKPGFYKERYELNDLKDFLNQIKNKPL